MARRTTKLPGSSHSGSLPKLNLNPDNKKRLSSALGCEISDEAFSDLIRICNGYLEWLTFEQNAEPVAKKLELLKKMKKWSRGFYKLAFGIHEPGSDVGVYLKSDFSQALNEFPVEVDGAELATWDGVAPRNSEPVTDEFGTQHFLLKLSPDLLGKIANNLMPVMSRLEKQIEDEMNGGGGFVTGKAFKAWINNLREWAKKHKYRHGPKATDGSASPFSWFVFELNGMMPEGCSKSVKSADAMARHIERARRDK